MFDEFGERELSEVIVESVKKLARLLALVILCLYTMKAGEEDVETLDAEGTEESFFCNGAEREEAAGGLYGSGLEAEEAADGLYANGVENEEAVGDLYAGGIGEERQVGSSGGDRAEARDGRTDREYGELHIKIIDELPPERELEICILEEEEENREEEDAVFVQMTDPIYKSTDDVWLVQENGSAVEVAGIGMEMNTASFFVPYDGSRCFGEPKSSTELFGEREWERRHELGAINPIQNDCAAFDPGIDATRKLVNGGYLNKEIAELMSSFPEIDPFERNYTLRLVKAGTTRRKEDRASWWEVDYALYTEADNGEELMLACIDIGRVTSASDEVRAMDVARYRIDAVVENVWRLMEDPTQDQGEVWLQQIRGNFLADEAAVRRFVEVYGGALLIPKGADAQVTWECRRQEEFYYDYLVWQGETADYEVTLAIPLMGKQDEGYYMASRIRREAEDKTACERVLSSLMQTFCQTPYLHVAKEGEFLAGIAEKYRWRQSEYPALRRYDDNTGEAVLFDNPDLIYPGEKVWMPSCREYDGRYK